MRLAAHSTRKLGLSILAALAVMGLISCGGGGSPLTLLVPAKVSLSFASLYFPSQNIGAASAPQSVTLTNTGGGALTVSSVAVTGANAGDFSASHTCGAPLAAQASCFIQVTFTPTAGGMRTASIAVTDHASGSPQMIALSGQGVPSNLFKLSSDAFTNSTSQHSTEVEPDIYAFGSTIVAAFQVGRFTNGGSSDIGYATSTDHGASWTSGFLPGITKIQNPANPYDRVSDPAVAYDSAHAVWIAVTLPLSGTTSVVSTAILVSVSPDGINWGNPITVATGGDLDKTWITCDNWPASPFFGNCYVQWDAPSSLNLLFMSTSKDGGLTWGPALNTANQATGIGGQPVVEPSGTVVVPVADAFESSILSFSSTDGGASWSATTTVSSITDHGEAGNLRSSPLPSATVDAAGRVYVVWQDCRFESTCAANDIVLSTSPDGVAWSAPARIPLDSVGSGVDHFIPGLGADPATSGGTAHLGLTYFFYPQTNCSVSTCQLEVGFTSSSDGGATWTAPIVLAGPMTLSSLPTTTLGVMVGDYLATTYSAGIARSAFAVAFPEVGGLFDEAVYTSPTGPSALAALGPSFRSTRTPVLSLAPDHPPRSRPARIR